MRKIINLYYQTWYFLYKRLTIFRCETQYGRFFEFVNSIKPTKNVIMFMFLSCCETWLDRTLINKLPALNQPEVFLFLCIQSLAVDFLAA